MLDRWKQWTPKKDVLFEFTVGALEQHQVVFSWSAPWSTTWIQVDGVTVLRKVQPFGITTRHQVEVGCSEVHSVLVDKAPVGPGLVRFRVLVDGEVVRTLEYQAGYH